MGKRNQKTPRLGKESVVFRTRQAGAMKHRLEPKGGAKNSNSYLEEWSGKMNGDFVWVDSCDQMVFVPDKRLSPNENHVYRPCRGYSATLAVEDLDGRIIGWILVDDLGFKTVKEWMKAVNYIIVSK